MKNLVQISNNNQLTTTSLKIAEIFGRQHKHILENIQHFEIPADFIQPNFRPIKYVDKKGREQKMYEITRDGFTLLAMGFTGKKAMQFKIDFIKAFNAMEAELLNRAALKKPTFAETLLGSRELKKENQAQKALIADMSAELLKSRPLWCRVLKYKRLGLSTAEVGKLVGRSRASVKLYCAALRKYGLLNPLPQPAEQLVLNFSAAETIPGVVFAGE
ncbi:MAG: Rha family transcriptional regulator [Proteobacteria bacterium]|nr:Rha family transcriptional regulator [Pseudomonadota bacterium]